MLPLLLLAAAAAQAPDRADLEQMFNALDLNRDGYVSQSEEPRIRNVRTSDDRAAVRLAGSWVERYDANRDSRVSRQEFVSRALAEIAAYRR
jgi:Ca2+-binding EF-hand superfamily protein